MVNTFSQTETCRLCHKRTMLCDSHIIPEFMYKPLYDSKHRFFRLSTGDWPMRSCKQKGLRERLLCTDCEAQFSNYERYASGVMYGGVPIEITMKPNAFEARVDYRLFKLFELSLIWRMGVTSVSEFNDVLLGSHERRLRKMLQNEEPGETATYGCILLFPVSYRQILDHLIMSMGMVKIQRVQCCRFIVAGMCWLFFLSYEATDKRKEGLFLQREGLLRILRGDYGVDDYTRSLLNNLRTNKHP